MLNVGNSCTADRWLLIKSAYCLFLGGLTTHKVTTSISLKVMITVFPRINAVAFIKFFMIWVRRLFEGGVYSRAAFI